MTTHQRTKLKPFTIDELRKELISRGSSMHAVADASRSLASKDLGGSGKLAVFSSKLIVESLKEKQKGIYGEDDRQDIYEINNPDLVQNSKGVACLFRESRVVDNGNGSSTLQVGKFGEVNSLCPDEPFYKQPVGAFCTGFLVAKNIIATAGHCVNEDNVKNIKFVFGFSMTSASSARIKIKNSNIYSGSKVIGRKLSGGGPDWCIVQLDRNVTGQKILKLRRKGKIKNKQDVYVIGHPCGLPMKIAGNATVRDNSKKAFFSANLDTYGGNSGSPVFNKETHEVEGILVRGAADFVPMGTCMVSAVCPTTGCGGEDCTRVSEFISSVQETAKKIKR